MLTERWRTWRNARYAQAMRDGRRPLTLSFRVQDGEKTTQVTLTVEPTWWWGRRKYRAWLHLDGLLMLTIGDGLARFLPQGPRSPLGRIVTVDGVQVRGVPWAP